MTEPVYSFGHFTLFPERRALLGGGQALKLGGRAFDVLLALVEHRDRVLSRDALMQIVWPRLVVEESNLNVQILMLRKMLGHPAIATVPGRGYRFALQVTCEGAAPQAVAPITDTADRPAAPASPIRRRTNLPSALPQLYGRADDIEAVTRLLGSHRTVTIAGAAGIGKTRLGQAVATRLLSDNSTAVWWVELAPIGQGAMVVPTIANALGLTLGSGDDRMQAVIDCLSECRALLVLDNCEHVLDAVAILAEALWASAPLVSLLITSQEPMKTAAEQVYRLGTLALPPATEGHRIAAVAASSAGALFLARARAVAPRFDLTTANVAGVFEVCRRLDCIPLAIELAAARLPMLGVEGLRTRLNQRFLVLTGGARTVLQRHQTLLAALEWSHALLNPSEQAVFRRLGVFAGGFTLESAHRVAQDDEIDEWDVLEHLSALIDKSLVVVEGDAVPRYKLLESTRIFALEKLAEAAEKDGTLRRHVQAMIALTHGWEHGRMTHGLSDARSEELAVEGDNVRAALDWLEQCPVDGATNRLIIEFGAVAIQVLSHASGQFEAFDRTVLLRRRIDTTTPPEFEAKFWLMLASVGAGLGQIESYEAATKAVDLYRRLGDDPCCYHALVYQIGIGARCGRGAELQSCVSEARRIERPEWPALLRGELRWACYRWLQSQGRYEEALASARERVQLVHDAGLPVIAQLVLGDIVADCELALGHVHEAEALCRQCIATLTELGVDSRRIAHVLEPLTLALVLQGRHDEAIETGRQALPGLQWSGHHFRFLEPLALNAAGQGRLRDAAWALGRADAAFARHGEVQWPAVAARRARLDALLADGLEAQELRSLMAAGASGETRVAFERVFGGPSHA